MCQYVKERFGFVKPLFSILCRLKIPCGFYISAKAKPFRKRLSPSAETPNPSENDFRQARKCQTLRETTFAKRGNAKPLGKRLSPCAEMPNHSGNDFRHARKCQTFRETTFAKRGFKHRLNFLLLHAQHDDVACKVIMRQCCDWSPLP